MKDLANYYHLKRKFKRNDEDSKVDLEEGWTIAHKEELKSLIKTLVISFSNEFAKKEGPSLKPYGLYAIITAMFENGERC